MDEPCWRDTLSIGSTDSYVSAAEVSVVTILFCRDVVLEADFSFSVFLS